MPISVFFLPLIAINVLISINMGEVSEIFRHTIQSIHDVGEKLDEHLQPIPTELHGAVTRTSPELLRHYEQIGIHYFFFVA